MKGAALPALFLAGATLALMGCRGGRDAGAYVTRAIGNPAHGRQIIEQVGCGSCHTIPGVAGASGLVGPPLFFLARRTIIGGRLPNTPQNLSRWIADPPAVSPGTAMPDLHLTTAQIRDVVAFLDTLR